MKKLVIWITGLSGAGKTTIANELSKHFENSCVIDGDEIRKERPNLGFSEIDRLSNVYHATYKAITHINYGGEMAIVALMSPLKEMRKHAKDLIQNYSNAKFLEVFIDTSLETCEKRDPKGLYKKARNGEIQNFSGIDSPYEKPENPEIYIAEKSNAGEEMTIQKTVDFILNYINNITL